MEGSVPVNEAVDPSIEKMTRNDYSKKQVYDSEKLGENSLLTQAASEVFTILFQ